MKPVAFIDLFAGMGGFTVGAVNAGATCIVAVNPPIPANRSMKATGFMLHLERRIGLRGTERPLVCRRQDGRTSICP